jgi:hypothetical protein
MMTPPTMSSRPPKITIVTLGIACPASGSCEYALRCAGRDSGRKSWIWVKIATVKSRVRLSNSRSRSKIYTAEADAVMSSHHMAGVVGKVQPWTNQETRRL